MNAQQDELYDAERGLERGLIFSSIPMIQDIVDRYVDSWWWQKFYPAVKRVEITHTSARCYARWDEHSGAGLIAFNRAQRDEKTLCHELAHVFSGALYGSLSHDPWYAREYLNVTCLIMGSDAYQQLRAGYEAEGVEVA